MKEERKGRQMIRLGDLPDYTPAMGDPNAVIPNWGKTLRSEAAAEGLTISQVLAAAWWRGGGPSGHPLEEKIREINRKVEGEKKRRR